MRNLLLVLAVVMMALFATACNFEEKWTTPMPYGAKAIAWDDGHILGMGAYYVDDGVFELRQISDSAVVQSWTWPGHRIGDFSKNGERIVASGISMTDPHRPCLAILAFPVDSATVEVQWEYEFSLSYYSLSMVSLGADGRRVFSVIYKDDEDLYALVAIDIATSEEAWRYIVPMYPFTQLLFNLAAGGELITYHAGYLRRLDTVTGSVVWEQAVDCVGYSGMSVGQEVIVAVDDNGEVLLRAYNSADGSVHWEYQTGLSATGTIYQHVFQADDAWRVYLSYTDEQGLANVELLLRVDWGGQMRVANVGNWLQSDADCQQYSPFVVPFKGGALMYGQACFGNPNYFSFFKEVKR